MREQEQEQEKVEEVKQAREVHSPPIPSEVYLDRAQFPDYIPLNGLPINSDNKVHNWKFELFSQVWDAVVKPHINLDCPTRIVTDGSAQFIVSRDVIRQRPLSLYEDLYAYTIGTKGWPGDEHWTDAAGYCYSPGGETWVGGCFFLEWIWSIIFGQPAVLPLTAWI